MDAPKDKDEDEEKEEKSDEGIEIVGAEDDPELWELAELDNEWLPWEDVVR